MRSSILVVGALAAVALGVATCFAAREPPAATDREAAVAPVSSRPDDGDETPTKSAARVARPRAGSVVPATEVPANTGILIRVLDGGAPVEGAEVRVLVDDPTKQRAPPPSLTGKDGSVRVVMEQSGYVVGAKDGRAGFVRCAADGEYEIELRPGVRLHGHVVDRAGAACPAAIVTGLLEPRPDVSLQVIVVTDVGGRFEFPSLPSDLSTGVLSATDGTRRGRIEIADEDETNELRIVLTPRVRVTGRMAAAAGSILRAEIWWKGQTKRVASDGTFEIERADSPGGATLVAEDTNHATLTTSLAWNGDGPDIDLGDVAFAPLRDLTGVFVLPSGLPAGKVPFSLHPRDSVTARFTGQSGAQSSDDGRFTVPSLRGGELTMVVYGQYPLPLGIAAPSGTKLSAYQVLDPVRAGEDLRVVLEPNPLLVLRATDASGAPVPFAEKSFATIEGTTLATPPTTREGPLLACGLMGQPPWRVVVWSQGYRTLRFTIDAAAPVIERTIVLRPSQ